MQQDKGRLLTKFIMGKGEGGEITGDNGRKEGGQMKKNFFFFFFFFSLFFNSGQLNMKV